MRVFLGLAEIAGYYTNLQRGFEALGLEALAVDLEGHPFAYQGREPDGRLVRLMVQLGRNSKRSRRRLGKLWWKGLQFSLRPLLLLWALRRYDVFIFGFGSTFLFYWELPLLKLLGKQIVYVFHGSDTRPPYLDGIIMAAGRGKSIRYCISKTRRVKRMLRRVERYADLIVCHPPSAQLHERPFVPYLRLGIPLNAGTERAAPAAQAPARVRILHSPSHPEAKGTPAIRQAIAELQDRGYAIDYVEISGQPNSVVLQELARCDFAVDQLYADTPMATFAAEAALLGKPVVVGGYAHEQVMAMLPAELQPPSHYCHPQQLQQAIEQLVVDQHYRAELGRRAHSFVSNVWTARQVAERYLALLTDGPAADWLYHPSQLCYIHGCCLSEARARELVRTLVTQGGKQALQLSDKPQLEARLLEFAFGERP